MFITAYRFLHLTGDNDGSKVYEAKLTALGIPAIGTSATKTTTTTPSAAAHDEAPGWTTTPLLPAPG